MTAKASTSHQIKVGLFTLSGIVIALFSLLTVGGDGLVSSKVVYHAYFDHVQGLNEGSTVSLSGIRIGNIKKFVFLNDQNKLDVWISIDKKYIPRITEGSSIEVRTQGALGDKFIFITPGPAEGKALEAGATLPVQEASDIFTVLGSKGGEASKIFEVISEVHKMTKAINAEDRLARVMKNFAEASEDLKETSKQTKSLVSVLKTEKTGEKMTAAVARMDHILAKIDNGEGSLGLLINDPSLHESLKAMVGGQERKKSIKSLLRSSIEDRK
jgi:phospholipid/cholesterol/gamma-HCH transport system substrate-binding protein